PWRPGIRAAALDCSARRSVSAPASRSLRMVAIASARGRGSVPATRTRTRATRCAASAADRMFAAGGSSVQIAPLAPRAGALVDLLPDRLGRSRLLVLLGRRRLQALDLAAKRAGALALLLLRSGSFIGHGRTPTFAGTVPYLSPWIWLRSDFARAWLLLGK